MKNSKAKSPLQLLPCTNYTSCVGRLCEMKRAGLPLVSLLVILLSLTPAISSTTCVGLPLLKPVHRICGVVFLPSGDRIANAKVTVAQGEKEVAVQETNENGEFSFAGLKSGKYEIRVEVKTLPLAAARLVLVDPEAKPKQEIAVNMSLNGCSTFSLVNPRKFEARANPK
jgi:hypothetical protein